MDCKQEFYLADAEGGMFVPGEVHMPSTTLERSRKEQVNCVSDALEGNGIEILGMKFDKTFETLTVTALYEPDSSSSSSSSDSSEDSEDMFPGASISSDFPSASIDKPSSSSSSSSEVDLDSSEEKITFVLTRQKSTFASR